MRVSDDYVVVEKIDEPVAEGFQKVEVQDKFTYMGRIHLLPARPVYIGNDTVKQDDTVIFAKYSPDTHEVDGKKFVKTTDLLAIV